MSTTPVATRSASVPGPPSRPPAGLVVDVQEREIVVPVAQPDAWAWLTDPATFVDAQVWPWRVEFLDPDTGRDADFTPGVLTDHHGPFTSLPGTITAVEDGYRDLRYHYGAFVGSPRLVRPVRLEVWADPLGAGSTRLRIRVELQLRPWLQPLSRILQRLFWGRFGAWLTSAAGDAGERPSVATRPRTAHRRPPRAG